MEIKFWIDVDTFKIIEATSFNCTAQAKREIKKIIYEHFDYIVLEWNKFFSKS